MADSQQEPEDGLLGRVQSLVRAFGILDELAKSDNMTLSDLSRAVGLPRSTTHRLLTTMEALRYVAFDRGRNGWSIGVQAFTVGAVFAQTRDLGQLGRTIMRSLMSEVQHCVNIAVPEGAGICYVGQAAANGFRQTAARPGAVLPLHTTASGKVLMAHWSRAEFDRYLNSAPLKARTARSIIDGDRLRREMADIHMRGYALDDEEHSGGLRCVAAVVNDRYGLPKGSLSISDRSSHLARARLDELGPTLISAAQRMSMEIAAQSF
ncbi:IclR family transcriptional regulator [Novosphingobium sp. Chol11]|uniref:IclR family transcriptional regulator n=1 Tax=Novosphingobium sp. Chol11 TaxID=1385763 RepID=UPI000BE3C32D|nr:IclR family transcriptional regulator [Novosphingobium sp. Chol11]